MCLTQCYNMQGRLVTMRLRACVCVCAPPLELQPCAGIPKKFLSVFLAFVLSSGSRAGAGAGASAIVPWKVTPPLPRVSEASGTTSLWPQWTGLCQPVLVRVGAGRLPASGGTGR